MTVTLLAVSAVAACGRQQPNEAPGDVAIGVVASLTGPMAPIGREVVQGAQLAAEVVNESMPGLPLPLAAGLGLGDGSRLAVRVADAKGEAQAAESEVLRLVEKERVAGLIVSGNTEVVRAATTQSERSGRPIIDSSRSGEFLLAYGYEWYFRTAPVDRTLLRATMDLLNNRRTGDPQLQRLVLLNAGQSDIANPGNPANPVTTLRLAEELADGAGYTVAGTLPVPSGAAAVSPFVGRVLAARPQAVVAVVTEADRVPALNEVARRLRGTAPLIVLGSQAGGVGVDQSVLRVTSWSPDWARRNPVARAVAELYERRFDAALTETAAAAFTATLTLAQAIDRAGSVDAARIRGAMLQTWLASNQTAMPWDGLRFDTTGQNQLAGAVIEQGTPGGYVVVYPRELAGAPLVWPDM